MNEYQRRERASRLAAVRQDLDGVLSEMDAAYVKRWRSLVKPEEREDVHRMVTLVADFKRHLTAIALDGRMADETITEREKRGLKFWPTRGQ